jgi:DNA-binding NarL/FixJ family response regulator
MLKQILIVDDHALFRQGLRHIIEDQIGQVQFGEAKSAEEALSLLTVQSWDLIILDINLPGRSGLDLIKVIKTINRDLPILVLSMYEEDQFAVRVIRAGASGYLSKDSAQENLIEALSRIASGQNYISPSVAGLLAEEVQNVGNDSSYQSLSDREFQVLRLIGAGKTVSDIARQLSLSVKTISTYRAHILSKLKLRNNAELILYAVKNRLID